jgi:hypothetical protein
MSATISIAELLSHEVVPQPHEAVAVAQAVIALKTRTAEPPFGPLSPDTVRLSDDGTVACVGCDVEPAVFEVAILLQALLASSVRVPGGLSYAIARALLEVESPPFDSLADFSGTLARFERGDRGEAVRNLFARYKFARGHTLTVLPAPSGTAIDRRRLPAAVTELRRHLREADRRLFEYRAQPARVAIRKPFGHVAAMAAGLAAGAALIIAGETMHLGRARLARASTAAAAPAKPSDSASQAQDTVLPPAQSGAPGETQSVTRQQTPARAPTIRRADLTPRSTANVRRRAVAGTSGQRRPQKAGRWGILPHIRFEWRNNLFSRGS